MNFMDACIFCKIVKGEVPTDIEMESDRMVVFKDVQPSAPIHYLIVTNDHIKDIRSANNYIWEDVRDLSNKLADKLKLEGFRLATNAGTAAMIPHMHIHFLAGINSDRAV